MQKKHIDPNYQTGFSVFCFTLKGFDLVLNLWTGTYKHSGDVDKLRRAAKWTRADNSCTDWDSSDNTRVLPFIVDLDFYCCSSKFKTMVFTLAENMRGFFVSRPPIVMFMICLASFAVALITFAYIVKSKDMADPDITEDWNTFLQPLSSLEYCVVSEPGAAISNSSQDNSAPEQGLKEKLQKISHMLSDDDDSDQDNNEDGDGSDKKSDGEASEADGGGLKTPSPTISTPAPKRCDGLMNVSVQVDLELIATANLKRIAARHNFTFITATMTGQQLGLKGRSKMEANLTLVLPPLGNQSHQCQHGQCNKVKGACVTFIASPCFFPKSPLPDVAEQCVSDEVLLGGLGGERENHFHLEVTPGGYIQCINASILTLRHPYDPTLTVMLTMQERSMINLHLMHTSYFLFVMIVTLLCYALVKGRAIKVKVNYTQCPSESSSAPNHTP